MTALAVVLPMAFHAVGLGSKFLPMLLPLLLNGFLSTWPWAILAAAIAPWLSALLTGMPPIYPPVALVMSCECVVMAGAAAFIYPAIRRRIWPALLAAIVLSRAVDFLLMWLLAPQFHLPGAIAAALSVAGGFPGVILQLVLVPLILKGLERRRSLLLDERE